MYYTKKKNFEIFFSDLQTFYKWSAEWEIPRTQDEDAWEDAAIPEDVYL